MPKFRVMDPSQVHIGRGRKTVDERRQYVEAIMKSDAGQISLDEGEVPSRVKRLLAEAAKSQGVKVRSRFTDEGQRTLIWKKVGA